jgi:hypothetical protein
MTDVLDHEDQDERTTEIPVVDGAEMADPEAPYGRRKDGTPKAKPGPRGGNGSPSTSPRAAAAPKPRKATATRAKSAPGVTDYRPGIMGLLQVPAMGLSMVGRQTKNAQLQADGMTIAMHAGNIAEALNMTAQQQPAVARALDNVLKAGPYGALIAAVVPMALQLAANHGVIPANAGMGLHAPEDLVRASNEQMAAMAAGGPAGL